MAGKRWNHGAALAWIVLGSCCAGGEKRSPYQVQAKAKVDAHCRVRWIRNGLPAGDYGNKRDASFTDCVRRLPAVQAAIAAKRPSVVFFASFLGMPSADEMQKIFAGKSQKGLPSGAPKSSWGSWNVLHRAFMAYTNDYRICIAVRFFDCIRVDVSSVTEEQNKLVNNREAPILVFVDGSGDVVEVLAGHRKATDLDAIFDGLVDALVRSGYRNQRIRKKICRVAKAMNKLRHAEGQLVVSGWELEKAKTFLATVKANTNANPASRKRSIKASEKRIEDVNEVLAETRHEIYELRLKEYEVLEKLGLPRDRLPPKPFPPAGTK